jgi:V/A-type H+-transporting ATPase subunit A
MEQVTGEEGISVEDYVVMEAARFVDLVFLQQDAFDAIDASMPLERQKALFDRVYHVAKRDYAFEDKAAVRQHFTRMTSLFKNLNYAAPGSGEAADLVEQIAAADEAAPVASGRSDG